jgi:hypothetical protein
VTPLAPTKQRALTFELQVMAAGHAKQFGVELAEVGSSNGQPALRIKLGERATARIITSVLAALRESKLKPAQLSAGRRKPLRLLEPAGVRLALVILGSAPISRRGRVTEIEEGVAAMSTEEAYYWYAKCTGREALRSRRALRLLLSDE